MHGSENEKKRVSWNSEHGSRHSRSQALRATHIRTMQTAKYTAEKNLERMSVGVNATCPRSPKAIINSFKYRNLQ